MCRLKQHFVHFILVTVANVPLLTYCLSRNATKPNIYTKCIQYTTKFMHFFFYTVLCLVLVTGLEIQEKDGI